MTNTLFQKALLNSRSKKSKNLLEKGFTLIELMVVVAIIGILSGVGLPQLLKAQDKAKDSVALATLTNAAKECSLTLVTENSGSSFETSGKSNYTLAKGAIELGGLCDFEDSLTLASESGNGSKVAIVRFDIGGIPNVASFDGFDPADTNLDGKVSDAEQEVFDAL